MRKTLVIILLFCSACKNGESYKSILTNSNLAQQQTPQIPERPQSELPPEPEETIRLSINVDGVGLAKIKVTDIYSKKSYEYLKTSPKAIDFVADLEMNKSFASYVLAISPNDASTICVILSGEQADVISEPRQIKIDCQPKPVEPEFLQLTLQVSGAGFADIEVTDLVEEKVSLVKKIESTNLQSTFNLLIKADAPNENQAQYMIALTEKQESTCTLKSGKLEAFISADTTVIFECKPKEIEPKFLQLKLLVQGEGLADFKIKDSISGKETNLSKVSAPDISTSMALLVGTEGALLNKAQYAITVTPKPSTTCKLTMGPASGTMSADKTVVYLCELNIKKHPLRILSYNIRMDLNYIDAHADAWIQKVTDLIISSDADIVGLQEVEEAHLGFPDVSGEISKRLTAAGFQHFMKYIRIFHQAIPGMPAGYVGNIVISKAPIKDYETYRPVYTQNKVYNQFDLYQSFTYEKDGVVARIYNIHPPGQNACESNQLLQKHMEKHNVPLKFVLGDFNLRQENPCLADFWSKFRNSCNESPDKTCLETVDAIIWSGDPNRDPPRMPAIDYITISKSTPPGVFVRTINVHTDWDANKGTSISDHLPVFGIFSVEIVE